MRFSRAIRAAGHGGPPPFAGRQNFYAANNVEASASADTNWVDHSTVTFQPDANSDYYVIWCASSRYGSISVGTMEIRLRNVTAGVTLGSHIDRWYITDAANRLPSSGIARLSFGASPSSTQVALQFRTGLAGTAATVRQSRVWIVKADAADAFAEAAGPVQFTDTFGTALTLGFTPGSVGDYIFIGSAEYRNTQNSGHGVDVRVRSGTTDHFTANLQYNNIPADGGWYAASWMFRLPALSGAQSFLTQHKNTSGFGTPAELRNIRLLAFRESVWAFDDFNENSTPVDYSANTADQNRARLTLTPQAKQHVQIGYAHWEALGTNHNVGVRMKRAGSDLMQYEARTLSANVEFTGLMLDRATLPASNANFDVDYYTTNVGTGVRMNRAGVALLRTET